MIVRFFERTAVEGEDPVSVEIGLVSLREGKVIIEPAGFSKSLRAIRRKGGVDLDPTDGPKYLNALVRAFSSCSYVYAVPGEVSES